MAPREPMRSNPAHHLRFGIDCLSLETRRALLAAIGTETIIAGAYTDSGGGSICPSVAVHRREGEGHRRGRAESLVGFARAWDAFTDATPGQPRVATEHELHVLRTMLEQSLAREEGRAARLERTLAAMASHGRPRPAEAGSTRSPRDGEGGSPAVSP